MNILQTGKARVSALLAVVVGTFSAGSYAALPAVVGTELTSVQTDALAAIDLVWPVVMAVLGGFIIMKIVKRGANKI